MTRRRRLHPGRRLARRNPSGATTAPLAVGALIGAGAGYWYATGSASSPALAPTLASQVGLAAGQVGQLLMPLGNYADNTYASEMYMPAANTVGAWLRVAYWLAVAGRIALGRGWVPTATTLQAQALRAFANGAGLAGLSAASYLSGQLGQLLTTAMAAVNPVASVTPVDSTEAGAVAAVFGAGVRALKDAQVPQVEALLTRLQATPPRPETSLSQRLVLPDFMPAWLKSWWGAANTTTWVAVGTALGGAAGYGLTRARRHVRRNPERISGTIPAWIPLLVGTGLILFPEPSTTAIGSIIVLGTLGLEAARHS